MENMTQIIIPVVIGIISLIIGFFIAKMLEKSNASKLVVTAQKEATQLLKNAKKRR
jgi:ribonuclease Y